MLNKSGNNGFETTSNLSLCITVTVTAIHNEYYEFLNGNRLQIRSLQILLEPYRSMQPVSIPLYVHFQHLRKSEIAIPFHKSLLKYLFIFHISFCLSVVILYTDRSHITPTNFNSNPLKAHEIYEEKACVLCPSFVHCLT